MVYDFLVPQEVVLYTFSTKCAGKITKLETLLLQKKGGPIEILKTKPKKLVSGNFAEVVIKLEKRISLELFSNNKAMGRIALRVGHETVAAGIIYELID